MVAEVVTGLRGGKVIRAIVPAVLIEIIRSRRESRKKSRIARINSDRIAKLLQGTAPILLELGAGDRRLEGWTSVDMNENCLLNLDLTVPLPFPDNSVSMIYSSHMLEHFKITELYNLLGECQRVLKHDGIFSASVPNARIYLNAYRDPQEFDPSTYCRYSPAFSYNSPIDYVNYMAYMDGHHKYMFDEENIQVILKKAGFRNVRLRRFDPQLDRQERDFQSMYIAAEK